MNSEAFRLLVADRYEEAYKEGPEKAKEALRWLMEESPVPTPWWKPAMSSALLDLAYGETNVKPTPAAFREFEGFERRRRAGSESASRRTWNPFADGSPEAEEHRRRFDLMIAATLACVADNESYDFTAAPILADGLMAALAADSTYRLDFESHSRFRDFVERAGGLQCLPVPPHVEASIRHLRKILAYWDRSDVETADKSGSTRCLRP